MFILTITVIACVFIAILAILYQQQKGKLPTDSTPNTGQSHIKAILIGTLIFLIVASLLAWVVYPTIKKVASQQGWEWIEDLGREVVIDKEIKPTMGGTFVTMLNPGYEYHIVISGCWSMYTPNNGPFAPVCADGFLPHLGRKHYFGDNSNEILPLNKDQANGMAVLKLEQKNHFTNEILNFFPSKHIELRLDANISQDLEYYRKSKGAFRVKVTRKKL